MYHTLSTSWNPQEETLLDTGECAADTIKQLLKYYVNHWCRTATTACGFYGICMKKILWDLQVNPIIIIFFHYNIFQHKIILLPWQYNLCQSPKAITCCDSVLHQSNYTNTKNLKRTQISSIEVFFPLKIKNWFHYDHQWHFTWC